MWIGKSLGPRWDRACGAVGWHVPSTRRLPFLEVGGLDFRTVVGNDVANACKAILGLAIILEIDKHVPGQVLKIQRVGCQFASLSNFPNYAHF